MADVKGDVNTNFTATPRVLPDASKACGVLQVIRDSYEAAALASGSTIALGVPVPRGARFAGFDVWHDALGTDVTLALGDAADDDRFMAAAAAATAGNLNASENGVIGGIGYQFTADTQLYLKTGGAAATGTIVVQVYYTHV